MASPAPAAPKPKKELTEAQRLAFLKGREKRMANLEKARLAKEEAKQQEINEPAPAIVIKEEIASPPTPSIPEPVPPTTHPVIDSDEIATKVVKLMLEKKTAKTKPKPKPKPRPVTPPPPKYTPDLQPTTTTFSWL